MSLICTGCRAEMETKKGTFTHKMFGKDIEVQDVPYIECKKCDKVTYENDRKVDKSLRTAFNDGLSKTIYMN